MKVAAKAARSLSFSVNAKSAGFATKSTLLSTSTLAGRISPSARKIASSSAMIPLRESISSATRSASCVLPQAVPTMARSSGRFGEKIPGVSTKMSCAAPSIEMPRISVRVVCTLGVTIETFAPTSALSSVDFPTFGAPISATKPQRLAPSAGSAIASCRLDALARQHGGGGGLFRGALGASHAFRRRQGGKLHGDAEFRIVIGTRARHLAIGRRRQAAGLRPFLQHGFWIAHRLRRGAHARLPQPFDQFLGGFITAVDIDRADHRLADVGEDRGPRAGAGIGFRRADPDRVAKIDGTRDLRAGFLAHQIGEPARQLTFIGLRE